MTEKQNTAILILAAGKGTRMKSALPKVLHPLAGLPMITHVLSATAALKPEQTVLVAAPGMEDVQAVARAASPSVRFAVQQKQLGTGNAVAEGCKALEKFSGDVLVVYGDTPLLVPETLSGLLQTKREHKAAIALLGMEPEDPTGYGRLIMQKPPFVERIVECKDASTQQKQVRWVWGGVMAFDVAFLREGLSALKPSSATGEYYLTALVEMAAAKGQKTVMLPIEAEEAMGVNSRAQLAEAESAFQQRLRQRAMDNGATLVSPETVFLAADTVLGEDTVVHPYVVFGPGVHVGKNVEIRSFCHIEQAKIADGARIGPYARLRPGTQVGEEAHIGNFVEIKQSHIERGAKVNHLSYVGDAAVGEGANVGAGVITCNYDGFAKHRTDIGAGAFIGSNASLVAPVAIGDGAIVGAGSVVTEDVPAGALAVERGAQQVKPGGATRIKEKKRKKS